jgi:hypothetical protein
MFLGTLAGMVLIDKCPFQEPQLKKAEGEMEGDPRCSRWAIYRRMCEHHRDDRCLEQPRVCIRMGRWGSRKHIVQRDDWIQQNCIFEQLFLVRITSGNV